MPTPERPTDWIEDLSFFHTVCKTRFDAVQTFVTFCLGQQVDWSCVELRDPFFLHSWRTKGELGLATDRVHKREPEIYGRFVYIKCRIPSLAVPFECDARLSRLDDVVTSFREAFGDELSDFSPSSIVLSVLAVTDDDKSDWDSGNIPSGSSFVCGQ